MLGDALDESFPALSREAKLAALREKLDASIAAGGEVSDDYFDAAIAARSAELKAKGRGV